MSQINEYNDKSGTPNELALKTASSEKDVCLDSLLFQFLECSFIKSRIPWFL
jgi:hypothetical protein